MLPYRPHPLIRNGHLQTLLVGLVEGPRPDNQTQLHYVDLGDGEQMVVHEELGPTLSSDAPLVVLVHGLGGDHSAAYLSRIAYQLRRRNRLVWRVDLRGSGRGFELAWRPANAGASSDLQAVIAKAVEVHPNSPIFLVGFSLSGNIVLKLLGELSAGKYPMDLGESGIQQALAIAPPIDLHDCADNMDRFSRRLYTMYYVKALQKQAQRKRELFEQWKQRPEEPSIKTIRQFDERYTAPLSGFRNATQYYSESSSLQWLPNIQTPTEIILDRDDPIVTWSSHLKATFDPSKVQFHHTRHGGHMGYFGIDDQRQLIRWLEYYVIQRVTNATFEPR